MNKLKSFLRHFKFGQLQIG